MTLFLIWGNFSTSQVTAQSSSGSYLKVSRSSSQDIVLELGVEDFQIETIEYGGQTYQRLVIPDMVQSSRPGEPQVPMRGSMLGVPSIKGVFVEVLNADYETLSGYRLFPAPGWKVAGDNMNDLYTEDIKQTFQINRDLYATDAFYPSAIAEIGHTGYMRDQPVIQVQFYPVQYNPATGELRLYHHILARVTWNTPLSMNRAKIGGVSPAYEHLLRNKILNYSALDRPQAIRESPSPNGTGIISVSIDDTPINFKIGVTEDGIYKLTYSDLTNAGLDLDSIDPYTIKISNRGSEIPIYDFVD